MNGFHLLAIEVMLGIAVWVFYPYWVEGERRDDD